MALTRPKYSSIYDTDFKVSCRLATTTSIANYSTGAPNSLDGKSLVIGNRILVKDQGTNSQNGVYRVTVVGSGSNGTWVRDKDFDSSAKVTSGILIPVEEGDTNYGKLYMLTTPNPITLDITGLVFTQISSTGGAVNFANVAVDGQSNVSAGSAGDTVTFVRSNNISITTNATAKSVTFNFDGANIVSISNANVSTSTATGALRVTGGAGIGGNIYAGALYTDGYYFANGSPFSVDTSQILNGNSNVKVAANANVTISVAGNANVVTVTGTGANVSGTANVSGNANVGNIGTVNIVASGNANVTGNITGGNILTSGSGGNISGANVVLANTFTSNVTTGTAPFAVSSTTQVANLNVATASNLINGTSNVIVTGSGNITVGSAGNAAIFTVTGTGANVSGTANVTGNVAVGSNLNVIANANVGNLTTAGQVVSTKTGDTADGNAQIYLNGATLNRIDFNTSGTAAPAFTTRSAGSKIVLYPSTTGSATDYAIGINSATLWQSLPQNDASMYFRWYGGTTEVANLSGTGMLTISGNANVGNLGTAQVLASANVTSPQIISNVSTGTAPFVVSSTTQVANLNVATAGNLINGNSNVVVAANSNVSISANGTANVVSVSEAGATVSGNLTITGNLTINGTTTTINTTTLDVTDLNVTVAKGAASSVAANGAGITVDGASATILYNSTSDTWVFNKGANISGNANVTGSIYAGNVLTDNYKFANGTAFSVDTTQIVNGNSNVKVEANSNVTISVTGNANVVTVTSTGANISGTLNTGTGNANVGNLGTATAVITTAANVPLVQNGNANVKIVTNGNIYLTPAGVANVVSILGTGGGTGNGFVGINNTNPIEALDIKAAVGGVAAYANITSPTASSAAGVKFNSGSNVTSFYQAGQTAVLSTTANTNVEVRVSTTAGNFKLLSGAIQYFIMDSNGNVGIGSAVSPTSNLHNVGTSNLNGAVTMGNTLTVAANITSPQIISNVATGTAPFVVTSTTQVANLSVASAGSLANGNSNVSIPSANGNVNINSVGNLTMTVTGTGANVAGTANITGNILAGANIVYTGNLYQGAQLRYAHAYTASTAAPSGSTVGDYWYDTATDILYLRVSDGTTPLWFDVSSQANTFSDTTTTNATITTASITTANISGNINAANHQNGNSNVRIVANGNVTVSATGTANVVVVTSTGANIAGTANVTGNANVGNLGTAAIVSTANNAGTLVSITDSNSVASSNKALSIVAGTNNLFFTPNSTSGAYNSLVNTNDIVIGFNGQSGQGTGNLTIAGWATTSGGLKFSMVANVTTIISSSNIVPSANATYSLGNTTNRWSNIWGLASSAQYADLAERYASDYDYDPGTVVIFGGNAEITVTNADHDPRIAGVISTNPGYLMNDSADQDALMLPVALTGRVPTRVRGPISKGDMVVSSTEEGVAIRMSKALYEPGCVIGKSLENISDDSIQTIEVVVGRL